MLIQWGIACGATAEIYIDNLIKKTLKLISTQNNVIFYLGLNSTSNSLAIQTIAEKYKDNAKVIDTKVDNMCPSISHGKTLDYLFSIMIQNNKAYIFSDADICVLLKDWDKHILKDLQEYDIVGVPYPPILNMKMQGFPCAFFIGFNEYISNTFSFCAKLDNSAKLDNGDKFKLEVLEITEDNKHIYKHNKIGTECMLDTSHEVYTKFYEKKMKCYVHIPYNNHVSVKNKDIDVYKIDNGEYLCTHFRKARLKQRKPIDDWIGRVNTHLEKQYDLTSD